VVRQGQNDILWLFSEFTTGGVGGLSEKVLVFLFVCFVLS